MTTIRRTYAYLIAFAGLAMLTVAAANLLQLVVDVIVRTPATSADGYVRDTVARYAAAALVALPVWLVHWVWIERWLLERDERVSSLRGLYLYGVAASAVLVATFSLHEVLANVLGSVDGAPLSPGWFRPLAFAAPALVVWWFHWRISARDRGLVGESGGRATLRRWYVYGLALVGLAMLAGGSQGLLEALWTIVANRPVGSAAAMVATPASSAMVGLVLWLAHWAILPSRLPDEPRREDGQATLRSVYLFLALTLGVSGTLFGVSELLYYAAGRLLGIERPGGVGGDLLRAAAAPASVAIVYGVVWFYQRYALRRQAAAFAEAPRQAGVRRLYAYLVCLVALGVLATGLAGLAWTLGDVLFSAPGVTTGEGWRGQVALYSTLSIVGLPVWLVHWRPNPVRNADVRSLARRLYLYLSLIGAMLTLLGSVAGALYRVIGLVLGGTSSVEVLTDLAHAAALALVSSGIAAYHWRVLRADARRAAAPAPASMAQPSLPGAAVTRAAPTALAEPAAAALNQVVVEIQAANAEALEHALNTLRATGVQVTVRHA